MTAALRAVWLASAAIALALPCVTLADQAVSASRFGKPTRCTLQFRMLRWSAIHRQAEGMGTIHCTNGQRMNVSLAASGGGITAGNARIRSGVGMFSEVWDIHELIGDYRGATTASGTAAKPAVANVLTNGAVTFTLSRARRGWNLGDPGGNFRVLRAAASTR